VILPPLVFPGQSSKDSRVWAPFSLAKFKVVSPTKMLGTMAVLTLAPWVLGRSIGAILFDESLPKDPTAFVAVVVIFVMTICECK
jgi:hypothetical protein